MEYCCEQKCFQIPGTRVDGLACRKCRSLSYCHCKCVKHKQWLRENYCCELLCIEPPKDICLLCQGPCYCLCVTRQKEISTKGTRRMTRINGMLVELVKPTTKSEYCCSLKCFTVPDEWIRGLACWQCKALQFCKCECETWKRMNTEGFELNDLKKLLC